MLYLVPLIFVRQVGQGVYIVSHTSRIFVLIWIGVWSFSSDIIKMYFIFHSLSIFGIFSDDKVSVWLIHDKYYVILSNGNIVALVCILYESMPSEKFSYIYNARQLNSGVQRF